MYYSPRYLFRRYEILKHLIPSDTFCEIGCGNLSLSKELSYYFKRGILVDFNEQVIKIYHTLPEFQRNKLDLIIADVTSLTLTTQVDCVIACEVIEHLQNDDQCIHNLVSMLKNNGQLIISVPAKMDYWNKDDIIVGHFRRYEKQGITKLLNKHGLGNIKILSYGVPFVNFFRILRLVLARFQYKKMEIWSQEKRSKQSAMMLQNNKIISYAGMLINPYTIYPLNVLSSFFNSYDLSDGYIIFSTKIKPT